MGLSSPADALGHGAIVLPDSNDSYPGVTGLRLRRLPAWILLGPSDRHTLRPGRPTVPSDSRPAVGGAGVKEPPVTPFRSLQYAGTGLSASLRTPV